ncbi:MAG: adenylate/guanylate cyclase domain-containing protein [Burkholderiaceae bacterium]
MRQRLAAVLAADAAGYSRLMGVDERGTLAALDAARAVFAELVTSHQGQVVDTAGDSVLAVFDTATGAVGAALSIQERLNRDAQALPEAQRLLFRIGVHLGDLIEKEDGTVYGDGVNIAARLQAIAPQGGVTVSSMVREAVQDRVAATYHDLGEQSVKNIAKPVRAYRVVLEDQAPMAPPASAARPQRTDKPAIAVLPLNNMSGEPAQEFFADGITEDIITELSRFRDLFVISRNSSFKYKGQPVNVQKFARELGVQYVLEGSVRKAGKRVRVTVQLIDAETDTHIWAERYDRDLEDIFAIQDELTSSIVSVLPGRVEAASRDRASRKPTDSMAAYECVLAGKVLHHRSQRADNLKAQELLDRAIALDPSYAHAHAWKACVLGQCWVYGWFESREATELEVVRELELALALDDNDSDVHRILAAVNLAQDKHEAAVYHQKRALDLNPNDDLIVVQQGELLTWAGQAEAGIPWILKAMRLNPYHPERFWSHLARAHFTRSRYDEAIGALRHVNTPDAGQLALLAACHTLRGDAAEARAVVRQILAKSPEFSVASYLTSLHYKHKADSEHHRLALLEAGLPAAANTA